jgi:ribonuclease J
LSKTSVTFFGGVNEIGGNKILLQDRDTRIFLDFGLSFAKEGRYFAGYLCPRSVNGAGDHLEFGLLPNLRGLYAEDAIKNTKINYVEPEIDGIVLSHAHFDHVGHLPFVDEKIPIFCGEGTKIILEAMEESSRINLGEHEYKTFRTGRTIRSGSIEIEPIHVDHSIPAAYGFIIHTSEGAIVYSGDLRIHGPLHRMTWEFAEKAGASDVRLMISEGTRISPKETREIHSEARVRAESDKVVAETSKLVIASFYSRDIDRFRTFYKIAKKNRREFVIPIKLAYLLHKLKDDPRLDIPDVVSDETVVFYKKRKKSGEYKPADYHKWERPFLDKAKSFSYVRENQSKVIFNIDLVGFTELIDVKPTRGGEFIHSMSEPFSEEDLEPKVLRNWLNHFGLRLHQIHASGHCPSRDLAKIIDTINPKNIVPIHTEHPDLFQEKFKNRQVTLVKEGEKIKL